MQVTWWDPTNLTVKMATNPVILEYESLMFKGLESVSKSLKAQLEAISGLVNQILDDEFTKHHILRSLNTLFTVNATGGKIVLCGVGKSFKIASKLCATLNSLSIQSVTLHPTEALHGDLGILNDKDAIIMLTASGNTPELLSLLPHLPEAIPIILLTCNKDSKLALHSRTKSLLYTHLPPHLKEETIHGVPAPTVSATLSLALADSVILALAELIEQSEAARKKLFSMKHPGGSIGANLSHLNDNINFSGSDKTLNLSYSSFLSLDWKREGPKFDRCSVDSSDSDEVSESTFEKGNYLNISSYKSIKEIDDFNTLLELDFLRFITLVDLIITTINNEKFGIETTNLKRLYIEHKGANWDGFKNGLTSHLKLIRN